MDCPLNLRNGVQRTVTAVVQKWLKKMKGNFSRIRNIPWEQTALHKVAQRDEKYSNYHWLCFELWVSWEGYTVKAIPTITGCRGGEIKLLIESISRGIRMDLKNGKDNK